jgi:DNA-binding MarR family transcriptional regulator
MSSDVSKPGPPRQPRRGEEPMYDLIEQFFFAYRDFVGDADRLLEAYGFGRAHHRVLYFVSRRPGLTIAELLEILRITKQSLNRVLRELVDKNFVEIQAGALDRRRRQLYATPDGERLALRLALVQTRRFALALEQLGDWGLPSAQAFLKAMIDPQKAWSTTIGGFALCCPPIWSNMAIASRLPPRPPRPALFSRDWPSISSCLTS